MQTQNTPVYNFLDALAVAGSIQILQELYKVVPPEARNYINSQSYLDQLKNTLSLFFDDIKDLESLIRKYYEWNIRTVETSLYEKIPEGQNEFLIVLNKYISQKPPSTSTPLLYIQIATLLGFVAIRAGESKDWEDTFKRLMSYLSDVGTNLIDSKKYKHEDILGTIRTGVLILQISFVLGKRLDWIKLLKTTFNDISIKNETVQIWFETDGSLPMGIILSPSPQQLNLSGKDLTDPKIERIVMNVQHLFPEMIIHEGSRYLAIQRDNPTLYDLALKHNPLIKYVTDKKLVNMNVETEQGFNGIWESVTSLITDKNYKFISDLYRVGIFPAQFVEEGLKQSLRLGYCELLDALEEGNNEARNGLWKNVTQIDLKPYEQEYLRCKEQASKPAEPVVTKEEILARHKLEDQAMEEEFKLLTEKLKNLEMRYGQETNPDIRASIINEAGDLNRLYSDKTYQIKVKQQEELAKFN